MVADPDFMVPGDRAAEIAGISRSRLWYWENKTDVIQPTYKRVVNKRLTVRLYSLDRLMELAIASALIENRHITLQHVRSVLRYLRKRGYAHPLGQLRFAVGKAADSKTGKKADTEIFWQDEHGRWYGDRAPEQTVAQDVVPVRKIVRGVKTRVGQMRAENDNARTTGRIVKQRNVLGAAPVFEGTRIPVQSIWDFLDAGAPTREILKAYPSLTTADVKKAKLLRNLAKRVKAGADVKAVTSAYPNLTADEIKSIKQSA